MKRTRPPPPPQKTWLKENMCLKRKQKKGRSLVGVNLTEKRRSRKVKDPHCMTAMATREQVSWKIITFRQFHTVRNFLTFPSHFPHNFLTISSHFPHISLTFSTQFPHISLTISLHFPHNFLTFSTQLPHNFLTFPSQFPHIFHTISLHFPHTFLTFSTRRIFVVI